MATKIRLQRHGKKGKPFFHLVAADSRAKRDGKFIEKLGTYNPTANPAIIDIDFENTLKWVQTGAEMTNTARAILSYKGVLYKNHLLNGVKKGALTVEQVEERFTKWVADKDSKVQNKKDGLAKNAAAEKIAKQKAEEEANAAKAAEIAAKNAPEVEEQPAVEEAISEETTTEDTNIEEQPAIEETISEESSTIEDTHVEEQPATVEESISEEKTTEETTESETPEDSPAAESTEEESAE
ncbi:MAG: 30S ribosomal protein S16 [Bacteroidota bacterium]